MRHAGKHAKPVAIVFDHYLDSLDRKDVLSFEKDLRTWIVNTNNEILELELRRIWFRIIDGDLEGAKTMILELQEQYIDRQNDGLGSRHRFYDRRLKEKGF
jgi:hypothetical protein